MTSDRKSGSNHPTRIIFLHHSTGWHIWNGNRGTVLSGIIGKLSKRLSYKFYSKAALPELFERYNKKYKTDYVINELTFPKKTPYGWNNYPFDYYNIWVKNSGPEHFIEEPTLEILAKKFQVIVLKHCFPVCNIQADKDASDVNSDFKSPGNYKLQYSALKRKMSEFPDTKFIVFTGVAQVKSQISEDEAIKAKDFFSWVVNEWDLPDDNIYIWDFYNIQTEGGLYFKDSYAVSESDSHPNAAFSGQASELLFNRIIDVIATGGLETNLKGERIPSKL